MTDAGDWIYTPGEKVAFGHYRQDANDPAPVEIIWQVLAQQGDYVLLLSEKILEVYPFQRRNNGNAWESSLPRNWLNTVFLRFAFDADEQQSLVPFTVGREEAAQQDWVTLAGRRELLRYLPDEASRRAQGTAHAIARGLNIRDNCGWWWLRSPGFDNSFASKIAPDGSLARIGSFVDTDDYAVRPALWIRTDDNS